jgi:hypothetical protein
MWDAAREREKRYAKLAAAVAKVQEEVGDTSARLPHGILVKHCPKGMKPDTFRRHVKGKISTIQQGRPRKVTPQMETAFWCFVVTNAADSSKDKTMTEVSVWPCSSFCSVFQQRNHVS